jgi:hypothetical protein
MDWIEQLLGISPDHGNGTLEAFISVASVCVATMVLLRGYLRLRRSLRHDSNRA